jgi:hypothetical protein
MQQTTKFSTTETALAAYLISEGFELSHIDYTESQYAYFFKESPNKDINFHTVQYMSNKAQSDPKVILATNKKLLRIIRRQIQWDEEG